MLPIDTLVTISLATLSLGTIKDTDGKQERGFWLFNAGTEPVTLVQGYTSCGCVGLDVPLGATIQPGDSVKATLSFDPKGKGGEFYERGTIVYGRSRKRLDIAMEGSCVTSEETLMRQFPVKISDNIRISAQQFDLGRMTVGESKTRNVVILHLDDNNRQECVPVSVKAESNMKNGVHHIKRRVKTHTRHGDVTIEVFFDMML